MKDNTTLKIVIGGIAVFLAIIGILFACKSCGKTDDGTNETVPPTMATVEEETTVSSGEIDEAVPETEATTVDRESQIEEIIDQLIEDVNQEPTQEPLSAEELVNKEDESQKENEAEIESQIYKEIGVDPEKVNAEDTTTAYDSDNNPDTREIAAYEEPETETIISEDGTPEKTPEYRIQECYEHDDYKGAIIEQNDSKTMHAGNIYHYHLDDGSKYGGAGDIVMLGQIGVDVVPGAALDGYYINTKDDTAYIDTLVGLVTIKKLNTTELRVEDMTAAQIRKLAGDSSLTFEYANEMAGSSECYSKCMFDPTYTVGVQYYACQYGIYEIKYHGAYTGVGLNLTKIVEPDSTVN